MKILIVGGGTGGTIVANNLARRLTAEIRSGKVEITMLSASDRHMYQPGLLYVAFGQMMRAAFDKFVEQKVELSVQRCREDIEALIL